MKTSSKKLAVLGMLGMGLFVGCAQNPDAAVMVDSTGKAQSGGVTPPNAPRTSADFMKQNKSAMSDPKNAKDYGAAQGR